MTRGLNMLGHAVAAAALVALVGGVTSDAAAARHRHAFQCRFAQRNTIATTREARVYVDHDRFGTAVFGCLYGSSRRRLLGPTGGEIGVTHVQLAGRYVGFFVQSSGARDSTMARAVVYVVDLKSGKRLHQEAGGGMGGQTDLFGFNIVLKADGAAGWIVETRDPSTNRLVCREVHRVDASGAAVLDSSVGIDERSLALGGSSLYWTDGGQVRSAQLR